MPVGETLTPYATLNRDVYRPSPFEFTGSADAPSVALTLGASYESSGVSTLVADGEQMTLAAGWVEDILE
jgi:hypothetical protein